MKIPSLLLRQLYTFGSLENAGRGFRFTLKNRLSDASLTRLKRVSIDDREVPLEQLTLRLPDGREVRAADLAPGNAITFGLRQIVEVHAADGQLAPGKHVIRIEFDVEPFGRLSFKVKDAISSGERRRAGIPYDKDDDYAPEMIRRRQEYVERATKVKLNHINRFSFDPAMVRGNVENFTGVAQVPIGMAGPLRVNGEHAQGEFLIPLATSEGTLVASYNRGMKVLNLSGGVTCTVLSDKMQRAPVFVFDSAREARGFRDWINANVEPIREVAEETSSVAKLLYIDNFLSNKFCYLRFNYSTGDAAGQNMVGRATFAACSWIMEQTLPKQTVRRFYLESNFATDKKSSQVNVIRTRGKRVTAEATIPRDVLIENMRVEPHSLHYHSQVATIGAFLSGANNNGAHSPNGIAAMFIATGQDVANVSESSAGILYTELTPDGDLYLSLTIPSLIVATYGGGTGLATQHECLELLGCAGKGKVKKLAEIVAGVALAGEVSLGSAISSSDWVSSHERYGRNR